LEYLCDKFTLGINRMKTLIVSFIVCILLFNSSCNVASENGTYLGLLKLIPDNLSNNVYILINYNSIWEDAGINFNPRNETRINREEILNIALSSLSEHIAGDSALKFSSFYSGNDGTIKISPIEYDTLGYDIVADVDAEIISFDSQDNGYMVGMSGDFTVKTTRSALQNQDGWPQWVRDNFQTEIYREIPVYSWGPSTDAVFGDAFKPPHLDYEGIARPLAATDGNMLVADSVYLVKGMVDASTDASSSLVDVPGYALIAKWMDSLDVYSVIISKEMPPNQYVNLVLPLQPLLAVGFGDGRDERGPYTAVVAVYDSAKTAENISDNWKEKMEQLESQFGEYATVIQRDDTVVIARIYIEESALGLYWVNVARAYR
jgi:hypothetical protein